jgi:hypothetical protein
MKVKEKPPPAAKLDGGEDARKEAPTENASRVAPKKPCSRNNGT